MCHHQAKWQTKQQEAVTELYISKFISAFILTNTLSNEKDGELKCYLANQYPNGNEKMYSNTPGEVMCMATSIMSDQSALA